MLRRWWRRRKRRRAEPEPCFMTFFRAQLHMDIEEGRDEPR